MRHLPSRLLSVRQGSFPLALFLAGCLGVSAGCGKQPKVENEEGALPSLPTALLLEQQVSGTILGKTLKSPSALASDDRGALYLIDAGNRRAIWFDARLSPIRDFSGEGSSTGRLSDPVFLSVDADHTVWITDAGRGVLVQCSDKLEFMAEIEPKDEETPQQVFDLAGIAVVDFGEVWLADKNNNRIAVLDALGQVKYYVGDFGYAGGSLRQPGKLLLSRRNHIYVCDTENRRIVIYDDRASFLGEIKHPVLERPAAVAVDRFDRPWILDTDSGRLHCFDEKGEYLASLGPIVSGTDRSLSRPSDLAFTLDGRLVISDTGNDRLLICRILTDTQP